MQTAKPVCGRGVGEELGKAREAFGKQCPHKSLEMTAVQECAFASLCAAGKGHTLCCSASTGHTGQDSVGPGNQMSPPDASEAYHDRTGGDCKASGTTSNVQTRWVRGGPGDSQDGGQWWATFCLSVTFLFISLLLSPQWRVRRIYWDCITETSAAGPQSPSGYQHSDEGGDSEENHGSR